MERFAALTLRMRHSSAGHPENAEKETGEDDLEPQRETHHARDHDAQRFFRIECAELADAPVL